MAADIPLTPPPVPPAMCPYCGEFRLIERDPVGGQWICVVCARTWREAAR